ncbi:MAG TPA: glycosyltransferase [Kiritimatiellia bacterium]|nr:glycosyltransferase [Kiritimatiellia bacterium]
MPRLPAVSILLPTHNRSALICRAVESVLAQSFSDLELIVIDDASTDNTRDVLQTIKDDRLKIHSFPRNRGQSAARNTGVNLAQANLIAFQDSDDEWLPGKLERQMGLMKSDESIAGCYHDLLRMPKKGEPFVISAPELKTGAFFDRRTSGYAAYGIGIQTCLFRKPVLIQAGGMDETMHCFEDLDLFLRINRKHRLQRIPEPLVHYHETDGVSKRNEHEYKARKKMLLRYAFRALIERPEWIPRELSNIRRRQRLDK